MGKAISATFEVDTKIYPMEAIYLASYAFIDKAYIYLSGNPKGVIRVSFKPKKENTDFEIIKGEFMNELLSSSLRIQIAERNKKVREYIVGAALLGASGEVPHLDEIGENTSECDCEEDEYDEEVDSFEAENNSWEDDPYGIAVPWEDKYTGEKKTDPESDVVNKEQSEIKSEIKRDIKEEPGFKDLVPGEDGIIDVSDEELAKYAKPWGEK